MFKDGKGHVTEGKDCELVINGRRKFGLEGEMLSLVLLLISAFR